MAKLTMESVTIAKVPPWEERANQHKARRVQCCFCRDQLSMAKVEAGETQCTKCEQAEEQAQYQRRMLRQQAEEEKRVRVEEVMGTLKPILLDIYEVLEMCVPKDSNAKMEVMIKLNRKLENL